MLIRHIQTRIASAAAGGLSAPDTSTPKARSGSRSSLPSGRFPLTSSTAVVSRHSQSPVATKRTSFRRQRKAADTAESVRLLTHQASVATTVLRRERAAFSGSVNDSGRAASSSPIKRNARARTQEARTRALFRCISNYLLLCIVFLVVDYSFATHHRASTVS